MASFSSSPASSSFFVNPGSTITVSQEEFNMFHNIDRTIFTRLIFNLGRDPTEATKIMSFWLWLERTCKNLRAVYKILDFPDYDINKLADEAVIALNCIQSDQFPYESNNNNNVDVNMPSTQSITNSGVTLRFFYNNRQEITQAVIKIMNDVCIRAFRDIVQRATMGSTRLGKALMNPYDMSMMFYNRANNNSVHVSGIGAFVTPNMGNMEAKRMSPSENWKLQDGDLQWQTDFFNNAGINEVLSCLNLNIGAIAPTWMEYGDIVEGIHMQEVQQPGDQQSLYARLVVRSLEDVEAVLGGIRKLKLNINGKHVWARKYMRKNGKSPLLSSFFFLGVDLFQPAEARGDLTFLAAPTGSLSAMCFNY
ncbi:Rho guanine nucleotide exchange factor [Quillaja saponaria]|uniref:Rho guanine nucleotide exchange factor n=1 Tax=Quillaja saponaria TaxID=32244 RepID=A0AAD7PL72_QUISA|nr:Rho guanine nucleotide exchange factor [Quillaja saponaria]